MKPSNKIDSQDTVPSSYGPSATHRGRMERAVRRSSQRGGDLNAAEGSLKRGHHDDWIRRNTEYAPWKR